MNKRELAAHYVDELSRDALVGFSVTVIRDECRITYRPTRFSVPWITVIPLSEVPALIAELQKCAAPRS